MKNTVVISKKKLNKKIEIRKVTHVLSETDLEDDNSYIELEIAEKMYVSLLSKVSKIREICNYEISSTPEIISNRFVKVKYNTHKHSNTIKWFYINKNYIKETIIIKNKLHTKYYQIHDNRFKSVTI